MEKKECELCHKLISVRNMSRHMMTHTGTKRFVCECGKGFTQKTNLERHMFRHHFND